MFERHVPRDMADRKSMSVRVDEEVLEKFDRRMNQLIGRGDLPVSFNRSEAVRVFLRRAGEDPDILREMVEEAEA